MFTLALLTELGPPLYNKVLEERSKVDEASAVYR